MLEKTITVTEQSEEKGHFIDEYLAYLLAQASHAVSSEFRSCLAEEDVSVIEWRVLSALADRPEMSVGRLSDIVICKQPTLSKGIDRMEAKGWVTRALSRKDRRVIAVSIDAPGMKITRGLLVKAKELEKKALDGFSKKEVQILKKTLRELVQHCSEERVPGEDKKAC